MNIDFHPVEENDDLLKELAEATEIKPEPDTVTPLSAIPGDESPGDTFRDFRPEPKRQPDPEPGDDHDPTPPISYKEQASYLIAFVDGFQSLALPVAYQRSYFTEEERDRLKSIEKRMKDSAAGGIVEAVDQELYKKYVECDEMIKNLPFTEKEVNLLTTPLAAVMEKYKFTPGPETLLMGAIFTVMAPRLAPLLVNLNK